MFDIKEKTLIAVKKKELHDRKSREMQREARENFMNCTDRFHDLSIRELEFYERKATMKAVKHFEAFMSDCRRKLLERVQRKWSEDDTRIQYSMKDVLMVLDELYDESKDVSSISEYNNNLLIYLKRLKHD